MGNRLSKLYTRTGDDGTTGLGDGARIDKTDLRIEAMGDVDELNATIGLILTTPSDDAMTTMFTCIQHDLFNIGGELALPGQTILTAGRVTDLEASIDVYNADLAPLKEFILPGGSTGAAYCHLARTVCRRAERTMIRLSRTTGINPASLQYLNRLSDLLFVACRILNKAAGVQDIFWQKQ